MINVNRFLAAVMEIVAENPTYRTGGRGADGTCDCVGLLMGAMYRCGHAKYPMHSSNYWAREEVAEGVEVLESSAQLRPGYAVLKARKDSGQLDDRYKAGGRYYTGDLLDYYHIGVVTAIDPLTIMHCTSSDKVDGIAMDSTIKGWTHFGAIADIAYQYTSETQEEEAIHTERKAMVTAPSGSTVNLRQRPDRNAAVVLRVPIGWPVTVTEQAQGWATVITASGERGYMMAQYLAMEEQTEDTPEPTEDAQETPSLTLYEESVLERLDSIIELLRGKQEGVG